MFCAQRQDTKTWGCCGMYIANQQGQNCYCGQAAPTKKWSLDSNLTVNVFCSYAIPPDKPAPQCYAFNQASSDTMVMRSNRCQDEYPITIERPESCGTLVRPQFYIGNIQSVVRCGTSDKGKCYKNKIPCPRKPTKDTDDGSTTKKPVSKVFTNTPPQTIVVETVVDDEDVKIDVCYNYTCEKEDKSVTAFIFIKDNQWMPESNTETTASALFTTEENPDVVVDPGIIQPTAEELVALIPEKMLVTDAGYDTILKKINYTCVPVISFFS